ncbi:TPA: hypothetical protein ACX6Q6_003029 [Photobacterium damselae]
MDQMIITKVELSVIEKAFNQTNEINCGFELFNRSFYQITDGKSLAYAVVYENEGACLDSSVELARFFVPEVFRNTGFGHNSAAFFIDYLFETTKEVLIDPKKNIVPFWVKVAEKLNNSYYELNYQEIDNSKGYWSKKE